MGATTNGGANGRLGRLGRGGGLVATVLLAVATVWSISAWEARETRARQAAAESVRLADQVHLLQALAERPGTTPAALVAARAELAQSFARLGEVAGAEVAAADLEALGRAIGQFHDAVDRFLADRAASAAPAAVDVDLAALAVHRAARDAADRADGLADAGAVLGFVAAVMLGGVLTVRRSRAVGPLPTAVVATRGAARQVGDAAGGEPAEAAPAEATQTQVVPPSRPRDRAFAATREGIAVADAALPGMPVVDVNPAFERLTGLAAAKAVGRMPLDLLLAGAEPTAVDELRLAMTTGREATRTVQLRRRDGGAFWAEIRVAPVPLDDGLDQDGSAACRHVVLALTDLTERRAAERRFREAEIRYRTLVERNPAATYAVRVGRDRPTVWVSPQIEAMLGYPAAAWRSDPDLRSKLVHPADRQIWEAEHERSLATGQPFRLEYRLIAKGGRVAWVRDEAVLVTNESGSPAFWQGFLLDVSDRKSLEERLEHQAFVDPLTGLPSRNLLLDRLGNGLARAGRAGRLVGILYLDLDDFARINDGLGRQVGDQVLKAVGERLERCVRQGDTVARLTADEFGLVLDELDDPADASRAAERIVEALRAPFPLSRGQVGVTGSVGVVVSRSAVDSPEHLLRDAEAALRDAKARGKGKHAVFAPGMSTKTWARLDRELELRRAIDGGEIALFYQPVVALDSGRIREVEALVRWQHPTRGLLVAGDFVPLAEETGLIASLGQRVLELGCRQVRAWQEAQPQEPPLVLNVNVSGYQLRRPGFAEEVGRILVLTGLEPTCLKLEIAESVAAADVEAVGVAMAELKALGLRLAIDDFGAGTCAMRDLQRFPIDAVTIDRSLVARLGPLGDDPALLRAVTAFAKLLDLGVTAEGIESGKHLRRLRDLGCDLGQGFHFAEPLSVEAMGELLAATPRWLEARMIGPSALARTRPAGVGTGLLRAREMVPAAS